MLHPRASLQLIVLAADKLASYKYAKKKDITNHFDDALIEAINEKLRAGRARAARGVQPAKPQGEIES